jgi:hypothetical protein
VKAVDDVSADRVVRISLAVMAASLLWLAVAATLGAVPSPRAAHGQRDTLSVNLERIGRRYLIGGVVPVRCEPKS